MSERTTLSRRLANQRIDGTGHRSPEDVVAWSGAIQGQEYEHAKWGVGLRMRDRAREIDVQRAFDQGRILRTHVLRPTWHFITPADIRWMLELTGPRVEQRLAIYWKQMGFDVRKRTRGIAIIERALGDASCLTRAEIGEALGRAKLPLHSYRLAHMTLCAELAGVICSGPRRGKQSTYALVATRAPKARRLDRDQALGELARRYLQSHGPATTRDFVWWSGLRTPDVTRALDIVKARREAEDGRTYWSIGASQSPSRRQPAHLLPIYDEYLVAYRDRDAIPYGAGRITSGYGRPVNFQHAVILNDKVAGTWRVARTTRAIAMTATMLRNISARERRAIADAAKRYERFQGMPVELIVE